MKLKENVMSECTKEGRNGTAKARTYSNGCEGSVSVVSIAHGPDFKKLGPNAGRDLGGIRDMDGLKRRCRIHPITDCWEYISAQQSDGSYEVYIASERRCTSLGAAVGWLTTGERVPAGKCWVAICGNHQCANPDHRKLRPLGEQARIAGAAGRLTSAVKSGRISATRRARSPWSDADIAQMRADDLPASETAEKWGMSESYARLVLSGARRPAGGAMSAMAAALGGL